MSVQITLATYNDLPDSCEKARNLTINETFEGVAVNSPETSKLHPIYRVKPSDGYNYESGDSVTFEWDESNYAVVKGEPNYYYFVDEIEVNGMFMDLHMTLDVLTQYRTQILSSTAVINRLGDTGENTQYLNKYVNGLYTPDPSFEESWTWNMDIGKFLNSGSYRYILVTLWSGSSISPTRTGSVMAIYDMSESDMYWLTSNIQNGMSAEGIIGLYQCPFGIHQSMIHGSHEGKTKTVNWGDKKLDSFEDCYVTGQRYLMWYDTLDNSDVSQDTHRDYLAQSGYIEFRMNYGPSTLVDPKEIFTGTALKQTRCTVVVDYVTGTIYYSIIYAGRKLQFTASAGTEVPLGNTNIPDIRAAQSRSLASMTLQSINAISNNDGGALKNVIFSGIEGAVNAANVVSTVTPVGGTAGMGLAGLVDSSAGGSPGITATFYTTHRPADGYLPEDTLGWYCGKTMLVSNATVGSTLAKQVIVSGDIQIQGVPYECAEEIKSKFRNGIHVGRDNTT